MFDIGWTELIVIACVAILVVGPKDLPGMLRNVGKGIRSLRKMTSDFQRQFDEALKEAELDDVAKVAKSKSFQPLEDAKKSMEAYQKKLSQELNPPADETKLALNGKSADGAKETSQSDAEAKPKPQAKPASTNAASEKPATKKKPAAKPAAKKAPAKKPAAKPTVTKKASKTTGNTRKSARSSAKTGTSA